MKVKDKWVIFTYTGLTTDSTALPRGIRQISILISVKSTETLRM